MEIMLLPNRDQKLQLAFCRGHSMTDSKNNFAMANAMNEVAIAQIIEKISAPNGFAKLNPQQRRLLLAAVLSSIVPADGLIRKVEMEHLEQHLSSKFQFAKEALTGALALGRQKTPHSGIEILARHLPELLSIEDRTQLIGMLWDVAFCDQDLHQNEEMLIHKVADAAGVLRKRVVEQQAIAASRNGMSN